MTHPGIETLRSLLAGSELVTGTLAQRRRAMGESATGVPPPAGVSAHPSELAGRRAEWLVPAQDRPGRAHSGATDQDGPGDRPTVLYLHGGGYCMGSLDTHRNLAGRLALASGASVVTLDYRLAPEHPFPAAVDDAVAAYRQLLADGHRSDRVALAGDSAGGGLVVAVLLSLREAGDPLPAAAACLSPWSDLTQTAACFDRLAGLDPLLSKEFLDEMAAAYLAGHDPRNPLASPLHALDLRGLPPLRIEAGDHELLLDDALALAALARRSDVDVSLTIWPDLTHVFQAFPGEIVPEADTSIAGIGKFLASHLGQQDHSGVHRTATTPSDQRTTDRKAAP